MPVQEKKHNTCVYMFSPNVNEANITPYIG